MILAYFKCNMAINDIKIKFWRIFNVMSICSWYNNGKVKIAGIKIEHYTLKRWILWCVNYLSKKFVWEKNEHIHKNIYEQKKGWKGIY